MSATQQTGLFQQPAALLLGVYVHVPFCLAKCRYCDFASRPLRDGAEASRYAAALLREIGGAAGSGRAAGTVYLGGGTPSILPAGEIAAVLGAVRGAFALDGGAEVTLEANPGTLSAGRARELRSLGVNRVSLGVQSLDDALLRRLGRTHTAAEARAAFRTLREAGFDNLSVDLIHALPGQTPAAWERALAEALALRPEHLSLYALGVEPGTALDAERRLGALELPSEDEELLMLRIAREATAAAGYEHYEVSSFARPGFRSRHNLHVWRGGEYRGFGAAAHSFLRAPGPVRTANVADPDEYVRRVEAGEDPAAESEHPDARTLAGELLMLGLRTGDGVDAAAFAREHGAAPAALFPEAVAQGRARGWLGDEDGRLRLTAEGMLFSNVLFRLLF